MSLPKPPFELSERAERLPVWEALSELWLDTELDERDWERIGQVLAASPYSEAELEAIHDWEVAPVLWPNLCSVAGEWAGFDLHWLETSCSAQALRPARGGIWHALFKKFVHALIGQDWWAVQAAFRRQRAIVAGP